MTFYGHEGLASVCLSVMAHAQEVLGGHAGRQRGHAPPELWPRLLQMQVRQRRRPQSGTHRSHARLAQCMYTSSIRSRHAAHQVMMLVQLWHAPVSHNGCPNPRAWAGKHIHDVMSTHHLPSSPLTPGLRLCACMQN